MNLNAYGKECNHLRNIHGSAHTGNLLSVTWPFSTFQVWARVHVQGFPSPPPLFTLPQKPAANSWDEKLDMIQEAGAETLRRIEAKLKVPGKIAGRLKKKIASELAEFRKALEAGFTQIKVAIQGMFTSKASENSSSSGHAAIQKHFDELWGAISNLGMLDLTTKAFSKGLITAEVKRMVFSTNGTSSEVKADALLSAIQERIKNDPSAFDVFVEILRSEPAYQHLADKLTNHLLP